MFMKYTETAFDNRILIKKLENCAKELELRYPDEHFDIVIVGGAALMLFNNNGKMTNDIDIITVSDSKIWPVLINYSMNGRVTAYLDSYSSDMEERYVHIDYINSKNVDYYICSLEDIVAAKLGANRDKDIKDIENPYIYELIDFDVLDKIIYEELKIDYFNETRYQFLLKTYADFKKRKTWQDLNH